MKYKNAHIAFLMVAVYLAIVLPVYSDVNLKALVINPSKTKTQQAVLKAYLPEEVKPEDINDAEDLKIDYDVDKALYYVYQVYNLKPGESVTKNVSIKDVWLIADETLQGTLTRADKLIENLKESSYYQEALRMQEDIIVKTQDIRIRQNENLESVPQTHIAAYRDNKEILDSIYASLNRMDKMVMETQAVHGVVVDKVSVRASWWVILGVIIALALLSVVFFIIWHGQAVKTKEEEELEEPKERGFGE